MADSLLSKHNGTSIYIMSGKTIKSLTGDNKFYSLEDNILYRVENGIIDYA